MVWLTIYLPVIKTSERRGNYGSKSDTAKRAKPGQAISLGEKIVHKYDKGQIGFESFGKAASLEV